MFGGDCVETASIGSTTVQGVVTDQNGNPREGVHIRIRKPKGGCPQSIAADHLQLSDANGEFLGSIYVHLGDPAIDVEVWAEGYLFSCRFSYSPHFQHSTLALQVILGDSIRVEGRLTGYFISSQSPIESTQDISTCE